MKIAGLVLILTIAVGCAVTETASQTEQALCTVADHDAGLCVSASWLLSYTWQWGQSWAASNYPGIAYNPEGGGCTDLGGGDLHCRYHTHLGVLEVNVYCDYESTGNGGSTSICWAECYL